MEVESPAMSEAAAHRLAWEQFRLECFLQIVDGVFCWSAACPADAYVILLHLMDVEGFMYDLSKRALVVTAYEARHVIPLAQLSSESMVQLQTAQSGHESRTLEVLRASVHRRFAFDTPPEDFGNVAIIH